jgi:hypothetical protein
MKSFYLKEGTRCPHCGRRFADNAMDQHKQYGAGRNGDVTRQCLAPSELEEAGFGRPARGVWVIDTREAEENFAPRFFK